MFRIKHIQSGLYIANYSTAWHLQVELARTIRAHKKPIRGLSVNGKVFARRESAERWIKELNRYCSKDNNEQINFKDHFIVEELMVKES